MNVTYERNGILTTVPVTLRNNAGNFDIVKADEMIDRLGADLVTLDQKKAKEYGIDGGVIVKKINEKHKNIRVIADVKEKILVTLSVSLIYRFG